MSFLLPFFVFQLFLIIFLAEKAAGDIVEPIVLSCTDPVEDIPHAISVGEILSSIYFAAPVSGFGDGEVTISSGFLYGFVLCRGDMTSDLCKTCIVEATNVVRERCPFSKTAVAYYDECMLMYRDVAALAVPDETVYGCSSSPTLPADPVTFANAVQELFSQLVTAAVGSDKLYAAGEQHLIYAYVQCTRNLSGDNCKNCLDNIISQIPSCCTAGHAGGRIIAGSCIIRFEIYPFID